MAKTFILGLGNQKCGTTWLHRYLKQSPNFAGGFAKEYHIWDALDVPILQKGIVNFSLFNSFLGSRNKRNMRCKMQNSDTFYFDYFASLFRGEVNLTADITPSYSGLKSPRLRFIKEGFSERGVEVKAVILLREPLSRIKSAVRSNLNKKNYSEGINIGETNFENALEQYYLSEHCMLRTRYDKIISYAFDVLGESNVYIGIHENMFEPTEIERLSNYLGMRSVYEFSNVYVNKTKGKVADTNLDLKVKEAYSEVYDFCFSNFPITKKLWR